MAVEVQAFGTCTRLGRVTEEQDRSFPDHEERFSSSTAPNIPMEDGEKGYR